MHRNVPEFLKATTGADTDKWRAAWDQIDQAVGDNSTAWNQAVGNSKFRKIMYALLICFGFYFGPRMQEWTCTMCPSVADFWDNPLLAFCFGFMIAACTLYYCVRGMVDGMVDQLQKRDKILRNIAAKVRYVCEDLNDGTMYLLARPNYDLAMITVDVYKSKPPAEPKMQNCPIRAAKVATRLSLLKFDTYHSA